MSESFREVFVETLCGQKRALTLIFSVSLLFALLSVISFAGTDPGTPAHAISAANLIGAAVLIGGSGIAITYCRRRE
jgi:hypothetical protein